MKTVKIILLFCIGFTFVSCDKDKDNEMVGYIIGYDRCSGLVINEKYGEAGGYFIATTKKDTLLCYNFPKDVFNFSKECFTVAELFPDEFIKTFKIRFKYRFPSENEQKSSICNGMIYLPEPHIETAPQIIITSVTKIN